MRDAVTMKMPREAHRQLRVIAALGGESMYDVCDRVFTAELARVQAEQQQAERSERTA